MKVAQWAEIRRLAEIERLSHRAIARRLRCSARSVKKSLARTQPPDETRRPARGSRLDPYKPRIDALVAQYPELSAVRVREEIARGPDGYRGGLTLVRDYLRQTRPRPSRRVYQEVHYEPGQALQIDWGSCGRVRIGQTWRNVSVFVAVLCYSRLTYLEFCLSQRKAEFYRSLVHALEFFGGSPRQVIFDNLKAAVLNGHGRSACLHPEFLALCGHFYLEPIPCARRDPESKGCVEASVRYVKHNALAGRAEELTRWEDYGPFAVYWRDQVANVRLYGREEVMAALRQALEYQTFDAAYVETLLLQERRRRELPSPTQLLPRRKELIDDIILDEPDPAAYDRFCADHDPPETSHDGSSPPTA